MLYSALQWLTSITTRFTTHNWWIPGDKGFAVVDIHCKNSWISFSNMVEDRGVWTPYPQVFTPLPPPNFFLPTPAPFFSLFFFRVSPSKIQTFLPAPASDPRPFFLTHPHPVLTPWAPVPSVLPHNMMIKKKYHGIVKLCKLCTLFLTLLVLKQKDSWIIGSTLLLLMLWPLAYPGPQQPKFINGPCSIGGKDSQRKINGENDRECKHIFIFREQIQYDKIKK